MAVAARAYDARDIVELGFPEAIQRRPGMYIGGRSNLGHLLAEVVDNAIDEAMAGACKTIHVTLAPDGSARVEDDGRGVPVAVHPESGKSALEMAFTQLHTGGKFGSDVYSTAGGLHGVGVKATNALSEWLEVTVRRDGVMYRQRYENGRVTTPVEILDPASGMRVATVGQAGAEKAVKAHAARKAPTGTTVAFKPSPVFMEVTEFEFGPIAHRLEVASYLLPGVTLTLTDERGDEVRARTYRHDGGLMNTSAS
jgi:DNA gyrase subunit B